MSKDLQDKAIKIKGNYRQLGTYRKNRRYEHREVAEKHLGRKLTHTEQVHHLDGNKANNDIRNLIVIERGFHQKIHAIKNGLGKDRLGKEPTNKLNLNMRLNILELRKSGLLLSRIQELTGLSYPTVQKYAKGEK